MDFETGIYKLKRDIPSVDGTLKKGEVVWMKLDRIIGETSVFLANTPKRLVSYLQEYYCGPYNFFKYLIESGKCGISIDSECEICLNTEEIENYLLFLPDETLKFEEHIKEFNDSVVSCDKSSGKIVNIWWFGMLILILTASVMSCMAMKTASQIVSVIFIVWFGIILYITPRIFFHDPKTKRNKLLVLYGKIRKLQGSSDLVSD